MLIDLAPHQQCAAIVMRLGGQARDLARMISRQEILAGGWRIGDAVTHLLRAWLWRFAPLPEHDRDVGLRQTPMRIRSTPFSLDTKWHGSEQRQKDNLK